jgi:trimethylamine:corrinoid methyltransferase-like protein
MFAKTGLQGDFLTLKETRALFRAEQHFPSDVIDRGAETLSGDILIRAQDRVRQLLAAYQPPDINSAIQDALLASAGRHARTAGLDRLPAFSPPEPVLRG